MICSSTELKAMLRKLRPRGRRLTSQGLEESQDGAAQEDAACVEASARSMEPEESSAAIQGELTGYEWRPAYLSCNVGIRGLGEECIRKQ